MKKIFLSSFFFLSLSLTSDEVIPIQCGQCNLSFVHMHDSLWLKKFASFDILDKNIDYLTSQSYLLFRITDSVLEINFHDFYLREGNFVSVLWNDWVGTRSTPLQISLTQQRFLRLFHTLIETPISPSNTHIFAFAMGNWQIFDLNVEPFAKKHLNKFREIYPAVNKIIFNLRPKITTLSYKEKISLNENFHPLVLGSIKPAQDIHEILLVMKELGIEVEFNEI